MSLEAQLRPRPVSPHLAIYRRTMMSIAHRKTGAPALCRNAPAYRVADWHMRIEMQVILEDDIHKQRPKVSSLALNSFFSAVVAIAGVYAVLKIGIQS